jgi:hypothetical protein
MEGEASDFDEGADQFHQLTTWLGKAPQLGELDVPLDYSQLDAPPTFASKFNNNPWQAVTDIRAQVPELCDVFNLGPFLFNCPGIWPRAVTRFVFRPQCPEQPRCFLHYFFRSANIEYLSISEAAKILLSRIALPNNIEHVSVIIRAFSEAYRAANQYINLSPDAVFSITRAAIVHALHNRHDESLPINTFLNPWLSDVQASDDFKRQLYEGCERHPIPLFFTFTSCVEVPNLHRSGFLYKVGSSITGKKKRWFVIEGFNLRYYKDPKAREPKGEASLGGTVTQIAKPAHKKDAMHLVLKRKDGEIFGHKYANGGKKKNNRTDFQLYGKDAQTLQVWATSCNVVSFLYELLQQAGKHVPYTARL